MNLYYIPVCFINKIRRQNSSTGRAGNTHPRECWNTDVYTSVYTVYLQQYYHRWLQDESHTIFMDGILRVTFRNVVIIWKTKK